MDKPPSLRVCRCAGGDYCTSSERGVPHSFLRSKQATVQHKSSYRGWSLTLQNTAGAFALHASDMLTLLYLKTKPLDRLSVCEAPRHWGHTKERIRRAAREPTAFMSLDTAGKLRLHAEDTELASGTHSRHMEPPFGAEAVWSLPKGAGRAHRGHQVSKTTSGWAR